MRISVPIPALIIILAVVGSIHFYLFWRIGFSLYANRSFSRKRKFGMGALFFLLFFAFRWVLLTLVFSSEWDYGPAGIDFFFCSLQLLIIDWITIFLFTFFAFLIADILTGFGYLLRKPALVLRRTVLAMAVLFSTIAVVQAKRQPVITEYEVRLDGLPAELDGTVAVVVSDTHIGSIIGSSWIRPLVARVNEIQPDLVLLLGDFFDGRRVHRERVMPELHSLSAPLGVWAILGNHDSHRINSAEFYTEAGFKLLHEESAEIVRGLTVAGVGYQDERGYRRGSENPVEKVLSGNHDGAVIFMSHNPLQAELAASMGADLMLSGHTHGGQIWPFGILARMHYPLHVGEYQVDGMTVIVSRGAGTWGPRMRLWHRGEIVKITLHSK